MLVEEVSGTVWTSSPRHHGIVLIIRQDRSLACRASCAFLVVNIDADRTIGRSSLVVAQRHMLHCVPPILSVGARTRTSVSGSPLASEARRAWSARSTSADENRESRCARPVTRGHRPDSPASPIDETARTVRFIRYDEAGIVSIVTEGPARHQQAEPHFQFFFFGALPIVDIDQQMELAQYCPCGSRKACRRRCTSGMPSADGGGSTLYEPPFRCAPTCAAIVSEVIRWTTSRT